TPSAAGATGRRHPGPAIGCPGTSGAGRGRGLLGRERTGLPARRAQPSRLAGGEYSRRQTQCVLTGASRLARRLLCGPQGVRGLGQLAAAPRPLAGVALELGTCKLELLASLQGGCESVLIPRHERT